VRKTIAVATKELRQIGRDRRTLMILLFVPAMFLLLYGYALNFDIRNVRLAVEDRDRTAQSRALVSAFVNSGYFDFAADITAAGEIERLMNRNQVRAALVIPNGYGRDILDRRPVEVQILIDGDNANTATTVMGYAQAIVAEVAAAELGKVSGRLAVAGAAPIVLEPRVWYNPQLRSTLFLVPGLIAYIAMLTAVVSTSLSVVREKEAGTMEQIRMSPIGAPAYVVGKTAPYFVISLLSSMGIVGVSMLLFDLPVRGSWLALLGCVSLFLVGALAFGVLISTIAPSQQVAFQIALLTSFLPTFMLSGFIFPISSMPVFLQAITHVVPARYFLVILRGLLLKGVELRLLWVDVASLALFSVVTLALASIRLKREWA